MVCIVEGLLCYLKRLFKLITVLVYKYPHKLGDRYYRVGVVELNGHILRQCVKRAVYSLVLSDYVSK